jgi:hypothetical protein
LWRSQDNGNLELVYQSRGPEGHQMSSDHSDEELITDPNPLGSISDGSRS